MSLSRPHILMALAALMAALAVIAGAFAAHALQGQLTTAQLATFDTASRYLMYHALALLALGGVALADPLQQWHSVAWLWLLGSLLFSGSLYLLSLLQLTWVVWLTPVGGLLMILGWLRLLWLALKCAARNTTSA